MTEEDLSLLIGDLLDFVNIIETVEGGDPFRTMPGRLVVIRYPTRGLLVDLVPPKKRGQNSGQN